MTLVNAETGEVVDIADETEARRIINRVTSTVAKANVANGDMIDAIAEALHRRAWVATGHGSWDDLVAAEGWEFNPRTSVERAALSKVFRDSGMSFRAIGKLVGASHEQIRQDTAGVKNLTPGTNGPPVTNVTPDDDDDEPETVTGTDGKTYPARRPRPEPEPDPVEEFVGSDDRTNLLLYRVEFIKALAKAQQVCSFEPERVAASADLDGHGALLVWDAVDRLTIFLSKWIEDLESHRPRGLRVVNGDKR